MEMGDGFASIGAVVDDEAKSFLQSEPVRDPAGYLKKMAEDLGIVVRRRADPVDPPFRDDEEMNGGLRIDVVDDDAVGVLVFDPGRDFPVDDAAEDRLVRHGRIDFRRGAEG